jgi:hypothetical protein
LLLSGRIRGRGCPLIIQNSLDGARRHALDQLPLEDVGHLPSILGYCEPVA